MGKKIVIALGGNSLGNTASEQKALAKEIAKPIVDLIEAGNKIIITHGNGPQIGMITLGLNHAYEDGVIKGEVPFPECIAMSQGYMGFHLQNSIVNELRKRGLKNNVTTIVTQILVDEKDDAFHNPTKPIGTFYDKETADRISREKGYIFMEDSGRGYRQVVPSPKPIDIIEKNVVKEFIDKNYIVIATGGGGVPVIEKNGELESISAVVDKDFASAKLAELVRADLLVILTSVDKVKINFGKADERDIDEMTVNEAIQYIKEDQFGKGSMLPKVEASVLFAEKGGRAIIADLKNIKEALNGKSGTRIVSNNRLKMYQNYCNFNNK